MQWCCGGDVNIHSNNQTLVKSNNVHDKHKHNIYNRNGGTLFVTNVNI